MHSDIVDYRNGKYQGGVNCQNQRSGVGIFIDDDLALHVSHWANNKLHGPTLLYLTHGKYIYGEWNLNQPHGLNIYRSGDTVLLSKFKQGLPSGRCLLIFEKYNFACVLGQEGGEWTVRQAGPVPSHKALVNYIQEIGLPFPEHYFSLTKFACTFSYNGKVKIFPCRTNLCYFGMLNGLGIIFNANNGVVSVGHHQNQELCEFGGRYSAMRKVEEGNFQTGDVVSYVGQRPVTKIYAIFQNMHRKSVSFCNEYFDPKTKVFKAIEDLLHNKLSDIAHQGRKMKEFNCLNLNDSLNYKEYDEQESFKMHENREKIYSPPKKTMERRFSNLHRNNLPCNQENSNRKIVSGLSRSRSPIKESRPRHPQPKQPQESRPRQPQQKQPSEKNSQYSNFANNQKLDTSNLPKFKEQEAKLKSSQNEPMKSSYEDRVERVVERKRCQAVASKVKGLYQAKQKYHQQVEEKGDFEELTFQNTTIAASSQAYLQNNRRLAFPQSADKKAAQANPDLPKYQRLRQAQVQHQSDLNQISAFPKRELKNLTSEYRQIMETKQPREVSMSPGNTIRKQSSIKRPTYEEIEQRRKRLLRDFKELNENSQSGKNTLTRQESNQFIPLSISNRHNKIITKGEQQIEHYLEKSTKKYLEKSTKHYLEKITKTKHATSFMNQKHISSDLHGQQPRKEPKGKRQGATSQTKRCAMQPIQSKQAVKQPVQAGKWPVQPVQAVKGKQNKAKAQAKGSSQGQSSLTPSKEKRTYQYMFD